MSVLLFAPQLENLYGRETRDAVRRSEVGPRYDGGGREGGPLGAGEGRRGPTTGGWGVARVVLITPVMHLCFRVD